MNSKVGNAPRIRLGRAASRGATSVRQHGSARSPGRYGVRPCSAHALADATGSARPAAAALRPARTDRRRRTTPGRRRPVRHARCRRRASQGEPAQHVVAGGRGSTRSASRPDAIVPTASNGPASAGQPGGDGRRHDVDAGRDDVRPDQPTVRGGFIIPAGRDQDGRIVLRTWPEDRPGSGIRGGDVLRPQGDEGGRRQESPEGTTTIPTRDHAGAR